MEIGHIGRIALHMVFSTLALHSSRKCVAPRLVKHIAVQLTGRNVKTVEQPRAVARHDVSPPAVLSLSRLPSRQPSCQENQRVVWHALCASRLDEGEEQKGGGREEKGAALRFDNREARRSFMGRM